MRLTVFFVLGVSLFAQADLLVVGSGPAGLAAALEAARAGLTVTVVERNSIFGGHAVISSGGLALIGTPLQRQRNIVDTPEIAQRDFQTWGDDAAAAWVKSYTENSKTALFDWMAAIGTEFVSVSPNGGGSSVPRFHSPREQGIVLMVPLRRELLRFRNVEFQFNAHVIGLLVDKGLVTGVRVNNLRTNAKSELRAKNVLIATGGFAANLELVRASWPKSMVLPERVLVGGGFFALGEGMELVKGAGGTSGRLDHQWNYASGLPDPFDETGRRGYFSNAFSAIWVNHTGKRFVKEQHEPKETIPVLVERAPKGFWAVFDAEGRKGFRIVHAGFTQSRIDAIFGVPGFIKRADSIEELAREMKTPPEELAKTVARFNQLVEEGTDADFDRFNSKSPAFFKPRKILQPPFYAAPMYILIRKSLGGINVDASCRVLTAEGHPVPGLYAAGEATGFGGLNGKNGIEGAFLGPSLYMGRIAAQTVAASMSAKPAEPGPKVNIEAPATKPEMAASCRVCHDIPKLTSQKRGGYWHFEESHKIVQQRGLNCTVCHAEMAPYKMETHKIDRGLQTQACKNCHVNPAMTRPVFAIPRQ